MEIFIPKAPTHHTTGKHLRPDMFGNSVTLVLISVAAAG